MEETEVDVIVSAENEETTGTEETAVDGETAEAGDSTGYEIDLDEVLNGEFELGAAESGTAEIIMEAAKLLNEQNAEISFMFMIAFGLLMGALLAILAVKGWTR